jgi:DNA-binding NarL/FixJ family response regulator
LIADDAEIVRRAIVQVVAQCCDGVEVVGLATDFGGMLRTIETTRPDVVLVDLNMPTEVPVDPEVLKAHLGSACLLVMSAWFDEPSKERARACGAVELLEKATLGDTLPPAIERCSHPKSKASSL